MLIGMQKIEAELWKRCASVVFGVLLVLEPFHIPGVLRVFSYLMTFLWLRRSGCVWLLEQRAAHLTPGVFIPKTKMMGFLKKRENFPWSVFQCNILSSAPRVTDWFTGEKRKGKRFQVLWGFFQWCISFAAVSLIYSKCGETSLTEQCWISQKIETGLSACLPTTYNVASLTICLTFSSSLYSLFIPSW